MDLHHRRVRVLFRVETTHCHHRHGHHHRVQIEQRFLTPNGVTQMNPITVTVGHTVNCSLIFLDQHGNPMLGTTAPDAPPVWSDTSPSTETLTTGPGGLTASAVAVAAGTDVISVALAVGGVSFSATLGVTVQAEPQVLTSVEITATVS